MAELSLLQMCVLLGVSRRAVQGYEQIGLVCPTGKTSRGYLLYDGKAQERVKWLKTMQNFGFTLKEIVCYEALSKDEQLAMLCEKREKMLSKSESLDSFISQIEVMISSIQNLDIPK